MVRRETSLSRLHGFPPTLRDKSTLWHFCETLNLGRLVQGTEPQVWLSSTSVHPSGVNHLLSHFQLGRCTGTQYIEY